MENYLELSTKIGSKIKFIHPNAGYDSDQEHCKQHLFLNEEYTLKRIDVSRSSSSVILEEFPDLHFNSVHFSNTSEKDIGESIQNNLYSF